MLIAADRSSAIDPVDYYDRDAANFAARYDSVSFEDVHWAIATFVPPSGSTVLDVGAGSGRDARALAAMGLRVTAIEPATELRLTAIKRSRGQAIQWLDDRLPTLKSVQDQGYALILCSAVLMLLPAADLGPSLKRMGELLGRGGHLVISLRDSVPGEPRGLVYDHSSAAIRTAASDVGLVAILEHALPDALGRGGHNWRTLVFERT